MLVSCKENMRQKNFGAWNDLKAKPKSRKRKIKNTKKVGKQKIQKKGERSAEDTKEDEEKKDDEKLKKKEG